MSDLRPSADKADHPLPGQLSALAPELRARLDRAGFDADRLVALGQRLRRRTEAPSQDRNRVTGRVDAPSPDDLLAVPAPGTLEHARLEALGLQTIARGEVAVCVMAGGMATRMGGVVKALVDAFDGKTFLDLRLGESRSWARRAGRHVPLWLMTSDATEGPTRAALEERQAPAHVRTFTQDLGLRLTRDGALFIDAAGAPSTYAPGHGDLPDALRRSGLLEKFVAGGGKYVFIANLDNLGATLDPALVGLFAERSEDVMVEVTAKEPGDRGGIPVWADVQRPDGTTLRRLQVLEEFRLPKDFDAAAVRFFNTNTFCVRAEPLLRAPLSWTWFEVEKKVGDGVAVQLERLLQELTAALPTTYVKVPREGLGARFLPVKDHEELARRREAIRAIAAARGMI